MILSVDYTKWNEAKAAVPADLSIYTDDSVSTFNKIVDKANSLIKASVPKTMDSTALELNEAINALMMKTADYSCIEEAMASVPKDLSDYTKNSVDTLNVALGAIEEGKLFTEQQAVDEIALAIKTATNNLKINYFRQEIVLPIVAVLGICILGAYTYKKNRSINIIEG